MAENYLQHAEHYFRIMAAQQAQMLQYQQQQQQLANGGGQQPRLANGGGEPQGQPMPGASSPAFSLNSAGMSQEEDETEDTSSE